MDLFPPLDRALSASPDVLVCPTCSTPSSARNLVVCIDGTSNQFSVKNTNFVELYSRLVKDGTQATFYNSGIGTYAQPYGLTLRQWIENQMDLAFAWRFDKILLSAYRWLSDNYQEGDRIFLFGFSRGAYQVRALSAMINDVGLIHKGNEDQIAFAYKLYVDERTRSVTPELSTQLQRMMRRLFQVDAERGQHEPPPVNMAARFKQTFSRKNVTVHFVGVWDTVSSIGLFRDKPLPGTTTGMGHVCYFRHALAIHERRAKFLPEFAKGSKGPLPYIEVVDHEDIHQSPKAAFDSACASRPMRFRHTRISDYYGLQWSSSKLKEAIEPMHSLPWKEGDTLRIIASYLGALVLVGLISLFRACCFLSVTPTVAAENARSGLHFHASSIGTDTSDPSNSPDKARAIKDSTSESSSGGIHEHKDADALPLAEYRLSQTSPQVKEVWFAGSHGNIGGGDRVNLDLSRFGPSLRWMSYEARIAGLHLDDDVPSIWFEEQRPSESLTALWWLLEVFPIRRLTYEPQPISQTRYRGEKDPTTLWPHLGRCRRPLPGQLIHKTALPHMPFSYDAAWKSLQIEPDLYSDLSRFLRMLRKRAQSKHLTLNGPELESLEEFLIADLEPESWRDAVTSEPLSENELDSEEVWGTLLMRLLRPLNGRVAEMSEFHPATIPLLRMCRAVLQLFGRLQAKLSTSQCRELSSIASCTAVRSDAKIAQHLIRVLNSAHRSKRAPLATSYVGAIFLPLLSGVMFRASGVLCIWNHEKETTGLTFNIPRSDWVMAVSPDGRFIASSGRNETLLAAEEGDGNDVAIWDTASGRRCLGPLPAPSIWSLAFSPDGTVLASGCKDGSILLWDTENGRKILPTITGPSQSINVVTFSPDGRHIVAGFGDGSICVRLVFTGEHVVGLFDAHAEIYCLVFSSDGSQFASGGSDGSLHLWDATTYERNCILPAPAVTTRIAFSPDGLYLASYSADDEAILVWDLATRCTIGEPVFCHALLDLAFERDGGALRAACADGTVRLVYFRLL